MQATGIGIEPGHESRFLSEQAHHAGESVPEAGAELSDWRLLP